ncbi:MAG: hypothetical protein Q9M91_01465 [Candidatus Dojkabacteria bacterium]|nr:hypothetical protein [Candidatus Dojkabacteria bacterium]MDQ7020493.1 hypothetical protein [Candidatus Dojkabacteria bacterium]
MPSFIDYIKSIKEISKSFDLDTTLQLAVDNMYNIFPNYNGSIIFKVEDNRLWSQTVSMIPKIEKALKYVPQKVNELNIAMDIDSKNLVVQSILNNKVIQSNSLSEFTEGAVSTVGSKMIEKILGFKVGISIPMLKGDEMIGAVFYTKRNDERFRD